MSKRTLALRWMQSIKSKTEQEQSNKVERNNSKLKEITKVITIKISDIVNRYITVGASKNAGNQVKVNSNEAMSTVIVIVTTIVTSSGKVKVMIKILIIMLLMALQIRLMMI